MMNDSNKGLYLRLSSWYNVSGLLAASSLLNIRLHCIAETHDEISRDCLPTF